MSTKNNASKKSFSCPDNEVHSKKTSSGDSVYWRCDTAYNTKNIPYAQLSIQIAQDLAGFPFNGKNSASSASNDRRLYCMTYKTKNGKESSCSSFFDYNPSPTSSRPGCSSPEDCYNKDSAKGSTPWVMPFVPNSVTAVVYASGSDIAEGIEDISQLNIYTFSISADGKSDQNESPKKYSPLKTIELK